MSVGTELELRDAIQKLVDDNPQYKVGYINILLKIENGQVNLEDAFVWDDEYLR